MCTVCMCLLSVFVVLCDFFTFCKLCVCARTDKRAVHTKSRRCVPVITDVHITRLSLKGAHR